MEGCRAEEGDDCSRDVNTSSLQFMSARVHAVTARRRAELTILGRPSRFLKGLSLRASMLQKRDPPAVV